MAASPVPDVGRSVGAAGLATNYHEVGGGPPVLLIHGSGPGTTAYANWRLTLSALGGTFRVLAPDLVGFGYTELPAAANYGLDLWIEQLIGFLNALAVPRAHVVGNSFGGAIALALAARYPERFGKLVLTGSLGTVFPLTDALDAVWSYRPSLDAMERLIRVYAYDDALLTPEIVHARYEASARPGYAEIYASLFPAPRTQHIAALATPPGMLRALGNETLIIHGREDRVVPWTASVALHELIVPSQLHVFGRCGHWTTVEKAREFHALVMAHLMA